MASGPQIGGAGSRVGGATAYFRVRGADPSGVKVEGRFVSKAQKNLIATNRNLAYVAQQRVVEYTTDRYKRPTVSSGRLEAVTAAPWNRIATTYYIGIGNTKRLDSSVAKYWRTIEEGSAATWKKRSFLSLELTGVFGGTLIGPRRAGGPFSLPNRTSPRGKFVPVRRDWYGQARFGPNGHLLQTFSPRKQIEPKHAYRRVFNEGRLTMGAVTAARTFVDDIWSASAAIIEGHGIKPR